MRATDDAELHAEKGSAVQLLRVPARSTTTALQAAAAGCRGPRGGAGRAAATGPGVRAQPAEPRAGDRAGELGGGTGRGFGRSARQYPIRVPIAGGEPA